MIELIPGRSYRRKDIHAHFKGQSQGGISTPRKHPVVLLFTGEQGRQYGYEDRFNPEVGTFLYTGEGRKGDMEMVRGNRAIRNHQDENRDLHLFSYGQKRQKGRVQYMGRAFYVDHHVETRPDLDGQDRNAIVFELELESAPKEEAVEVLIHAVTHSKKLSKKSFERLRVAAYEAGKASFEKGLSVAERKQLVRYRSAVIKDYVLRRANGTCEGCEGPAPFKTPKGEWYLEPHHICRVADDGPDHPLWVIALCPTCHARVHHSADGAEYNQQLEARAMAIEMSLSPKHDKDPVLAIAIG